MKKNTFIIAEAGVNHDGSLEKAKELVDIAVWSGADAVKFQTFVAEKLVTRFAPKAKYQMIDQNDNQCQFEMLKRLELDFQSLKILKEYCGKKDIIFLSSPFDVQSVRILHDLKMSIFKVPSGEITNLILLYEIGSLGKQVILSTGMADIDEVGVAIEVLIKAGTTKNNLTVLHCHSEYPTKYKNVNLVAMKEIQKKYTVKVGYSDHTLGIHVPLAAVALGAEVIEKHFTKKRTDKGPDHKASLEPKELKTMVKLIREIEESMGDGKKKPSLQELENRKIVRKSLVAAKKIQKGDKLSLENVCFKRPGTGISVSEWDKFEGTLASRNFDVDEMIER